MYTIYADGQLIHAPHLVNEGCGVLSPKLTVELNKAGSFDYTMPPINTFYNSINKLKSIITVFQNGEEMFRGRVLHDQKDFYNQKKVYCEGELAFLLDSQQRPYSITDTVQSIFQYFITNHNSRVETDKQFTVGNVTIDASNDSITCENEDYTATYDELTNKLLNVYGGYLKIRVDNGIRYIDWLKEYGVIGSQVIEFGRNLLDITEHITAEDIFTVIIPLGKTLTDESGNTTGKLDVSSVNDGNDYLENESAINLFGRIEKIVEWSEVEDASTLKDLGQTQLSKNIEMAVSLDVKAVDLHLLDVNTDRLRLGDYVQVLSAPHGLNNHFQCTKITYDLESPDLTEYVFGLKFSSLTEKQINDQKGVSKSMIAVQSATNVAVNTVNTAISTANTALSTANTANTTANSAAEDVNTVVQTLPVTYATKAELQTAVANVLPVVTTVDNGKVLKVVNGVWSAVLEQT